jgi:hypothetical protein
MGHRRLSGREAAGAGISVLALLFLALSLIGGNDQGSPGSLLDIGIWLGASAAAAGLALAAGRALHAEAVAYGIAGGLLFSCGDISTKLATQGGTRVTFALPAIAGYVLGTSLVQIGYQRGTALTIAGIATLLTNALPIAAGPVLLDEPLPGGILGVLRVLAFALAIVGAALLARPPATAAGGAAPTLAAAPPAQPGAQDTLPEPRR